MTIILKSSNEWTTLLEKLLQPYAKLWPLHSFNACNPLVGLEYLPFHEALKQSQLLFGTGLDNTNHIFKKLYDSGAFTIHDINHVIEKASFPNQIINSLSPQSYQSLCRQELIAIITCDETACKGFTKHQQQGLLEEIISNEQPLSDNFKCYLSTNKHQWINEQLTKYLAAYLDDGQALWSMPGKDKYSLLECWIQCITYDNHLSKENRRAIKKWYQDYQKDDFSQLLGKAIELVNRPLQNPEFLLNEHLRQLPGWVGYLKYYSEENISDSDLIVEYLIIRLLYHWKIGLEGSSEEVNDSDINIIHRLWMLYEGNYQSSYSANDFIQSLKVEAKQWRQYLKAVTSIDHTVLLMQALEHAQQQVLLYDLEQAYQNENLGFDKKVADAQAVFCIDVRSEPYRKALEVSGNIETYGFAGFFGLPIAKQGFTDYESTALCPILLKPQYTIPEVPLPIDSLNFIEKNKQEYFNWKEQWIYALKKIKRDSFGTFGYVEGLGSIHGLTTVMDTFFSGRFEKTLNKLSKSLFKSDVLKPAIHHSRSENRPHCHQYNDTTIGIPIAEQIQMAETILNLMDIRQPFSEFVVICGHTGQANNNPYASALDCGACGANGGGYNARVLCDILNQSEVRQGLSKKGINIPDNTVFLAAEHNTTTNFVIFLNAQAVPHNQYTSFIALKERFEESTQLTSTNQQRNMKQPTLLYNSDEIQSMAWDWSQTRPEWGLSKNQVFIVGQRKKFKHINLNGRAFLHSYNWENDVDGSILTMIMTAPMVVGTWINCQYLFSTLDQSRFGSGNKYTHNIVGLFGTYQGNQSDLQLGLPYESLFQNDGTPYHYPQRLLVCIEAPYDRVEKIINDNVQVSNLVNNDWIKLVVFDPQTKGSLFYKSLEFGSFHMDSLDPAA